jgi:hypothetical protein
MEMTDKVRKKEMLIEDHLFGAYILLQTSERKNKNIFYFSYFKLLLGNGEKIDYQQNYP